MCIHIKPLFLFLCNKNVWILLNYKYTFFYQEKFIHDLKDVLFTNLFIVTVFPNIRQCIMKNIVKSRKGNISCCVWKLKGNMGSQNLDRINIIWIFWCYSYLMLVHVGGERVITKCIQRNYTSKNSEVPSTRVNRKDLTSCAVWDRDVDAIPHLESTKNCNLIYDVSLWCFSFPKKCFAIIYKSL